MQAKSDVRNEEGQAMVEFALVLPLLLLLLFGIIQFGIAFNNYIALTDAVRAGSRKATVSRHESCPSCVTEAAVKGAAAGLDTSKMNVQVSSSWQPGEEVRVVAQYPVSINIIGKVVYSGSLTSEIKERVE
jgi:Flp pilus assembly protein TadG